ncbi:hypothetical protein ASPFODRAFT_77471 [Aspergillus luchuensis CBS 106.47]|uniref:CFEM domain-containing protein n=2 Tax=Aspergillus subgen. Circumdati TaxID=2720871 RepID=A0A1M3TTM6_ASPLC|nr:CFEM domain protein [Aspergillus costaricaensis CBS 115574]OJZ90248.1 hypothetical protein ASPFODRAFT_77471 [Aspergillus luchuensis CBS 106.47]RAK89795.1 CFEM domain protein [Aspergillus costaricaensis CBS 115574]
MHLVLRLFLVTSWILIPVFGQLETIGLTTSGVTPTSTLLSTANPTSSLSSPPTSATPSLTTTSPSVTNSGDSLVLTTVFTQPPGCAGGMTEIPAWSTELWQNIVNPVSTMTLSSCYPSQFYYSAIATRILPPYKQLVCPEDWETYNVTDTYIICCPSNYGVYMPNYQNSTRPGLGAVCTSSIWPDVLMDITSYDSAGSVTVIPTIAGDDGALVFATAFDGTKATAVASSTSMASTSPPSAISSTSSPSNTAPETTIVLTTSAGSTASTSTSATATITGISQLPTCGQTCFDNMLAKYDSLGCETSDPSCLCRNINFYYGIRDCANAACGTAVASTVLAFESGYCTSAIAAETTYPVTSTTTVSSTSTASPTAISDLPTCGQTCFNNMLAKYSSLGCSSPDPACLCENINFYYGIRDCSNAACGTEVATTVLAFESSYCASATAAAATSK